MQKIVIQNLLLHRMVSFLNHFSKYCRPQKSGHDARNLDRLEQIRILFHQRRILFLDRSTAFHTYGNRYCNHLDCLSSMLMLDIYLVPSIGQNEAWTSLVQRQFVYHHHQCICDCRELPLNRFLRFLATKNVKIILNQKYLQGFLNHLLRRTSTWLARAKLLLEEHISRM